MGPTVGILIPDVLSSAKLDALQEWIIELSLSPPEHKGAEWLFWIEGHPMYVRAESIHAHHEPEELRQLTQHFGCDFKSQILVYAGCNREEDHRKLGELTLVLAERLDGVIDFDGMLRLEKGHGEQIASMPGTIVPIWYEAWDGRKLPYHVGDAVFMQWWLKQPAFHLVK